MKSRILLIVTALIMLSFSCGKKENGLTGPENSVPVLSSIEDQTVTVGQTKDVTLSATDADGDSLTFSITTNPEFLSIKDFYQTDNTATATLVIEPEKDNEGSHNVSIQVSDGIGGTDSENFIITVIVPPYSISDIVGMWSGNAQSSNNNFTLDITIDSEGNASGTGAQGDIEISDGEWNINNEGEITGSNGITIRSSGMVTVQWSNWSLQLNQDKDILTGEFSCNALGTMDVNLSKQ